MSSNGLLSLKLIHEGTTLDDIVHALAESVQRYFPVVDAQGKARRYFLRRRCDEAIFTTIQSGRLPTLEMS